MYQEVKQATNGMGATWQSSIKVKDERYAILGHNEGDPPVFRKEEQTNKARKVPFPGKMTRDVASRKAHAPRPHLDPGDRHRGFKLGLFVRTIC